MAYNGSGDYSLPAGQPVVTGTTISSTTHNNLANDMATAFDTAFCRDGQAAATAAFDMGGFRIQNMGVGTGAAHAATVAQIQNAGLITLSSVAGTNTITGSASPTPAAYAAGQVFEFTPAVDNTGATTINVSSLGAKNIFWNGAACVGGELRTLGPVRIKYDGTQFNILGNSFNAPFNDAHAIVSGSSDATKKLRIEVDGLTTATTRVLTMPDENVTLAASTDTARGTVELATTAEVQTGTDTARAVTPSAMQNGKIVLGTPVASTSGATIDFNIPSWSKRVTINFLGVSTNGTSIPIVQIGDAGGIETSGYLGAASGISSGVGSANFTTGFGFTNSHAATSVFHGSIVLTLENASSFTWAAFGVIARSDAAVTNVTAGTKPLSAALTQVRITTVNGTDAFDAGEINVTYD